MHTTPTNRRTLGGDLRRFARRYGWRAYALPVLSAITVAALLHTHSGAERPVADTHSNRGTHSHAPAKKPVTVEGGGADAQDYAAGATPVAAPIVVSLASDDSTSCTGNRYQQLVVVSISKQHMWACEGHKQVDSTPVTTGETDNGDQTPLGSWRVQAKQRDRYLVGPGYRDYVRYWVPFNGDFGFHDASWQKMPFGSQGYKTNGSHGCIHLPTATMAWFYRWASVYDTVVTVEA